MTIKSIIILFSFFFSCNILAYDSTPEPVEYGEFPSPLAGCKGRLYETSTQYNLISPAGQNLWKIHDDIINFEDEYTALNIHACRILPKRHSLNFLITKFEIHPHNIHLNRSLDTFLSCLRAAPDLFNSNIIYAWIPKEDDENLLKTLTESYFFKKSQIKLKDSNGNRIKKPKDIIQLKVSIDKLTMVNVNAWLQALLVS